MKKKFRVTVGYKTETEIDIEALDETEAANAALKQVEEEDDNEWYEIFGVKELVSKSNAA